MEPTLIRKALLNKVIEELEDYDKESPATGKVFATVSKYFYAIPENLPAVYVANRQTNRVDPNNLNFDDLRYGFTAYVYEPLEANSTQAQLSAIIDRLVDCEEYLRKFIARVPNNFGQVATGITVYSSEFVNANYNETPSPKGRAMELAVQFDLMVNINVQLINTL